MNVSALTLQEYICNPLGVDFEIDLPDDLKDFLSLLKWYNQCAFGRAKCLKNIVSSLCKGQFKPFKIEFLKTIKPLAYMHDKGVIYFSYGSLLNFSASTVLSVFCHELAHVWLSQREYYTELKELDRQFKDAFREKLDGKTLTLASPVEVYAMLVSVQIMQKVLQKVDGAKKSKKLELRIAEEREKLDFLNRTIVRLK